MEQEVQKPDVELNPQSKRASRWGLCFALGLPALLAVALMAPRILHAQFGLFDDATYLLASRSIWAGTWDLRNDPRQFGRFSPLHWMAFALLYRWAGQQAGWYFAVNLILLVGVALMLGLAMFRLTGRALPSGATALAFVLGVPTIESVYTLSKAELLQCFFLSASAVVLAWGHGPGRKPLQNAALLPAALLVFLAALTKETTVVVLGIVVVWAGLAALSGGGSKLQNLHLAQSAMLAAGIGIASYGLVAVLAVPSILASAGPRANFTLTWAHIAANAKLWLNLIVRGWSFLVPLLAAAGCLAVSARKFSRAGAVLCSLAWMAVWVGLFLPYRFTPEYYLLPFSLGSSVLTGYLILQIADSIRTARPAARVTGIGLAALSAGLFLLTLPNNLSNARIQLAVDQANADMLERVAQQAPLGARVFVNIREDIEYLWSIGPMLRLLHGRTDLQVEAYPPTDGISEGNGQSTWIVSPLMENVPWPSVRLGIPEVASRGWEAGLQQDLGDRLRLDREVRQSTRLLIVDAPRLLCLAVRELPFCQRRNAPFDTRVFAAGWRVYVLKQDGE